MNTRDNHIPIHIHTYTHQFSHTNTHYQLWRWWQHVLSKKYNNKNTTRTDCQSCFSDFHWNGKTFQCYIIPSECYFRQMALRGWKKNWEFIDFFEEKHLDLSPWHKDFHQFFYYGTLNSIMQTILFTIFHFFHSLLFDIKSNGMMTVP